MHDRLLRRRDVERITGVSRASIYRLMQQGVFPRPVKVGSTAVRWKESDIAAWIDSRPVAASELGSDTTARESPG
ncbi:MAG: AlpA family transcriptional regulator [Chloroflexi bacterium]|nr:AlpA family transcriptional regulator [Chloroflexota bacterium]